jgi:hypothetical protein
MSSKIDNNNDKIFNGGSLVEWIIVRDIALLEADRLNCKYQLVYSLEDIVDGVVQEAAFSAVRICEKGQEAVYVDHILGQQIEAVRAAAGLKRERIEALPYARNVDAQFEKQEKLNAVEDRLSDDIVKLEQSKHKTLLDTQAAGARFDAELRQFDGDRAKAIGILRKYLGSNPRNSVVRELAEQLPRAAWKKLTDLYENDVATGAHLNNTQNLMSNLQFNRKMGDASEHMGILDRLNETLIAAGNGKNEAELVNYLISAMEKSKDGALYKTVLDYLTVVKMNRAEILEACRAIEQKAANAETLRGSRTLAGARFGKADVVAGANAAIKAGKNNKVTARRTNPGRKPSNGKSVVLCVKCCKPGHFARDCDVDVECSHCKKKGHCERFCWVKNPSLRPAIFNRPEKANAAQEVNAEKDLTKVNKK